MTNLLTNLTATEVAESVAARLGATAYVSGNQPVVAIKVGDQTFTLAVHEVGKPNNTSPWGPVGTWDE